MGFPMFRLAQWRKKIIVGPKKRCKTFLNHHQNRISDTGGMQINLGIARMR